MTKLSHLLEKFFENPTKLHFSKIDRVLMFYGCIRVVGKGSHIKYKHKAGLEDLVIPLHNNDCKSFYKNMALKFIKKIKSHERSD